MKNIYDYGLELLKNGESFALATIMEESGSTPRSKGAKMIVKKDGSIIETVGGGAVEAQCIEKALEVIREKRSQIFRFNLTNKDAALSEMICGGDGEILIAYITSAEPKNKENFKKAVDAITLRKKGYFVMKIGSEEKLPKTNILQFVLDISDVHEESQEKSFNKMIRDLNITQAQKEVIEGKECFIDPLMTSGVAYLFGGGHVSKETALILNFIGFETVVIDDRADFANKERFPKSKVIVVESLEELPSMPMDENAYILIMTRGHLFDRVVLEWALKTSAGYIGMIGSRRKIKMTYDNLIEKGVTQKELERVHAPIGIKLAAQTPSEIAISIGAELINCRAEK